jgi:hypothetical protein
VFAQPQKMQDVVGNLYTATQRGWRCNNKRPSILFARKRLQDLDRAIWECATLCLEWSSGIFMLVHLWAEFSSWGEPALALRWYQSHIQLPNPYFSVYYVRSTPCDTWPW